MNQFVDSECKIPPTSGDSFPPFEYKLPETPFVVPITIPFAQQSEYAFTAEHETVDQLEAAERDMLEVIHAVSCGYDDWKRNIVPWGNQQRELAQKCLEEFELSMHHLNPKTSQIAADSESGQIIIGSIHPVVHTWNHSSQEEYQTALRERGIVGFLALRLGEKQALLELSGGFDRMHQRRHHLGLGRGEMVFPYGYSSPYDHALGNLEGRLVVIASDELDRITFRKQDPFQFNEELFDYNAQLEDAPYAESFYRFDHSVVQNVRKIAQEKAEADFDHSLISERNNSDEYYRYREVFTYTIDEKTGMRFVTRRSFRRKNNSTNWEMGSPFAVEAEDQNGNRYELTPSYVSPEYFAPDRQAHAAANFSAGYWDKGSFYGIDVKRQLEIWHAYCRATCDGEGAKKAFQERALGKLDSTYWGFQKGDMENYAVFIYQLKMRDFLENAKKSIFGRIRLGIRFSQTDLVEATNALVETATAEQLQKMNTEFSLYRSNPSRSEVVSQSDPNLGYIEFNLPYGGNIHMFPSDYGKTMQIRLSEKGDTHELLIRDAYESDEGPRNTRYLRLSWKDGDHWYVERGKYSSTSDAYFLEPDGKKQSLTKFDAETISLALSLLALPKQKRE